MTSAPLFDVPLNVTNWVPLPDIRTAHIIRERCLLAHVALSSHTNAPDVYTLYAGVEYSLDPAPFTSAQQTAHSLTIKGFADIEEDTGDTSSTSAARPTASCVPVDLHWEYGAAFGSHLPREQFVFNSAPYSSFVVISAMLRVRDEHPRSTSATKSTGMGFFAQLTRRTAMAGTDPPTSPPSSTLIPAIVAPIVFLVLAVAGFALFVYLRRRKAWRAEDDETEFSGVTPYTSSRRAGTASTGRTASSAARTKSTSKSSPIEVDLSHL